MSAFKRAQDPRDVSNPHAHMAGSFDGLKTPLYRSAQCVPIWSAQDVADRFQEAASTARRLPSANVQGYFNAWPTIVRTQWEAFAGEEPVRRCQPPSPQEVARMLEVMRWVVWLQVEQRHLVWMRAKRYGWRDICTRFGVGRTTAWQRWQEAVQQVAEKLNESLKK